MASLLYMFRVRADDMSDADVMEDASAWSCSWAIGALEVGMLVGMKEPGAGANGSTSMLSSVAKVPCCVRVRVRVRVLVRVCVCENVWIYVWVRTCGYACTCGCV